eukprot:1721178-Pyramimonas_sp.AAC.1
MTGRHFWCIAIPRARMLRGPYFKRAPRREEPRWLILHDALRRPRKVGPRILPRVLEQERAVVQLLPYVFPDLFHLLL